MAGQRPQFVAHQPALETHRLLEQAAQAPGIAVDQRPAVAIGEQVLAHQGLEHPIAGVEAHDQIGHGVTVGTAEAELDPLRDARLQHREVETALLQGAQLVLAALRFPLQGTADLDRGARRC